MNYAVSLAVLAWRTGAALVKAMAVVVFGLCMLGQAVCRWWPALAGGLSQATAMALL